MSEYTPTTEEVRNKFWLGEYDLSKTDWITSEANFNRWLAEVMADVWQDGAYHIAGKDNELVHVADTENPYRQEETE